MLRNTGSLGQKVARGLLSVANTIESSAAGGMISSIPGYSLAKNAVHLGNRVSGYAERLGEALQEPNWKPSEATLQGSNMYGNYLLS